MATGAANTNRQTSAGEAEQRIQRQLDQTRRRVKFMDLATATLTLLAGVLGFLMLAAVVDHWLFELGFWGRLTACLLLLAGVAWYFAVALLPLLLYRINPVYAARVIERSSPSLKNSLINFLMFRSQPAGVHRAVYQEMERRAATDLDAVDLDATLDRTRLLRMAYVLIAILAVCAAYRILSPKNPFQSFSRVMIPWADIARPSRLEIIDVRPGEDQEIYFGRSIEVSAGLRVHSGARVPMQLVYSSADRQIERRSLEMEWVETENRYRIELPGTAAGIQQDLVYELVAGDAKAGPYELKTIAEPTILVEQVEYEPPAYTRQAARTSQQADVRGLEGTRVTVHARANQPIQAAYIQFDPQEGKSPARSELVEMRVDDDKAWGSFTLRFTEDRRKPWHSQYQVWFLATDKSRRSENALTHTIDVSRDLPPVVDILNPKQSRVDLPLDSTLQLEVRAVDPDFGLSRIRLRAVSGGAEILSDERTYDDQLGQVVETFDFVPRKLKLNVGDVVTYRATAEDNRQDAERRVLEPNIEQTPEFRITITEPRNQPSPESQQDEPKSEPNDDGSMQDKGDGALDQGAESSEDSGGQGEPQTGDEGEKSEDGEDSQKGDPEAGENGSGQSENSQGSEGSDQKSEGQDGENADPNGAGGTSGAQSDPQGKGEPPAGESAGQPAGQGQGDPSGDGQTRDGTGTKPTGEAASENEGPVRDLREDPLHDGEVIERVKEYSEQQQEQQKPSGNDDPNAAQEARDQPMPGQSSESPDNPPSGTTPDTSGGSPKQPMPGGGEPMPGQQRGQGEKRPGDAGGEGGNPQGPMDRKDPDAKPDDADSPQSEPGMGDNGASGAGSPAASEQGSAESQGENRDRPKQKQPGDDDAAKPSEPQSPSGSKKQSDSEGDQGGDRSGGGQQGPGQSAQRKGNDSAGSQSDADQGAGASENSGQGDTAARPGEQETADSPTGSAGSEKGPGSTTREKPDDVPGSDDGGQPQGPGSGTPQRGAKSDGPRPNGSSGQVTGGGVEGDPADGNVSRQPAPPAANQNEEPDLDYANKATDLVLEYLEDQQQKPDPKLLDELGWTEEDMRKFVERWKNLKQQAQQDGDPQELQDALKSLGLKPERDRLRKAGSANDQDRGLRETGNRTAPPPSFLEQFNAARRGVAKGEKD